MCVIAYFEKDRELNKVELENCFEANPDGAGLMYYDKNKEMVHIQKGFMDFDSFWEVASKLPTSLDRVFHFRIATSGKISGACCHPFVVSDNYEKMSRTDVWGRMGMVHNGVMYDYTPAEGMKSKHSDTMQFIKEVVSQLPEDVIMNTALQTLWNKAMGTNKYIVLSRQGTAVIGNFTQSQESGALYSNTSYMTPRYTKYTGVNWDKLATTSYYSTLKDDASYDDWEDPYYETYDNTYEYPIEVWTGRLTDEAAIEYVDKAEESLMEYDVYILDFVVKDFSIVLYLDNSSYIPALPKEIAGKCWTKGNKNYNAWTPKSTGLKK